MKITRREPKLIPWADIKIGECFKITDGGCIYMRACCNAHPMLNAVNLETGEVLNVSDSLKQCHVKLKVIAR